MNHRNPSCAAFRVALAALATLAACCCGDRPAHAKSTVDCGDACCDCGSACNPYGDRLWFRGEYLAWQLDGMSLPPLVTSSPAGTALDDAGQLGQSTTTVLSGSDTVIDGWRSGFALSAGYWLDACGQWAIVGDYFNAGRDSYGYTTGPNTGRIIARPFFNSAEEEQDAQLVDVPDELAGSVRVQAFGDFQGAGAAIQRCLWSCGEGCRTSQFSLLGGYRYYQYDSLLAVDEHLLVLPNTTTPLVVGTTIDLSDKFATRNTFHGGELGIQGQIQKNEWWLDGLAAVAVGGHERTVFIDGSTTNTVPGAGSATGAGGLLTSGVTNIGRYQDTRCVVIPRFRLGVGCQITEHLSGRSGYNVIVWDDVAQAAAQLPSGLAVDPANLPPVDPQNPGGADPAFAGIRGSTLVAHGIDLGLQLNF